MKILVFGDIFAKYGRKLIVDELSNIKAEYNADFVIANGENSANGKGITRKVYNELIDCGIEDVYKRQKLTGPGKVYLQTMNMGELAGALSSYIPTT